MSDDECTHSVYLWIHIESNLHTNIHIRYSRWFYLYVYSTLFETFSFGFLLLLLQCSGGGSIYDDYCLFCCIFIARVNEKKLKEKVEKKMLWFINYTFEYDMPRFDGISSAENRSAGKQCNHHHHQHHHAKNTPNFSYLFHSTFRRMWRSILFFHRHFCQYFFFQTHTRICSLNALEGVL